MTSTSPSKVGQLDATGIANGRWFKEDPESGAQKPSKVSLNVKSILSELQSSNKSLEAEIATLQIRLKQSKSRVAELEKDSARVAELQRARVDLEARAKDQEGTIASVKEQLEDQASPLCAALFRYEASEQGELSMSVSDAVSVWHELEDGWSYGENIATNEFGFFPSAYVSDHPPASNLSQLSSPLVPKRGTSRNFQPLAPPPTK
ncbi:hypothetical protein M427DRAFT_250449 [Gonapodya prolifera JEL478]|uniref:SH3 domain-containing protein n=1 Tax=Gonapodya prolifera (strain JEL478) TaxID=1344416 RepID=A0A138ZX99_GONPJ|nr:hypothetical protein M427DRAFT_250449 [Gonapodya prolifera JEL478]|eukprot:KXS09120.1 hypothetical protein M427DRAFT_250449 [Gonapodya prolifera JEL478]